MIHPIFITLAKQPRLFMEHADAYAELAMAEVDGLRGHWQRRAVLGVVAGVLVLMGVGLAGIAGLLYAVIPLPAMPEAWLLLVIPLVPLLIGLVLVWQVRQMAPHAAFATLREQVTQDLATLKILDEER